MGRWTALVVSASLLAGGAASAAPAEGYYGKWLGKIAIPNGPTLSTGLELFRRADGTPGALMVSPDQGQFSIPVDRVTIADDHLELSASSLNIQFSLTRGDQVLTGEARQGPLKLPVELRAVSSFGEPVRPQTPTAPFPYVAEDMVVMTPDGVALSGTFTHPSGSAPRTVVVFLQGSGPVDRDEAAVAGHRPFAVLADHLAREGIASFRYDKRGVNRSTGDYASAVATTFADDALAVVRAIRARSSVRRVGVLGHSEGGLIAAMIAAREPAAVDFVISLAGPGINGRDLMLLQDHVARERRGLPQDQIAKLDDYSRRFYEAIIANEQPDARMNALRTLIEGLSDADKPFVGKFASQGSLSPGQALRPAERALLLTDAPSYWASVKCPVLALNGTLDVQVPPEQNLAGIRSALASAGNRHAQVESLPGLNHLFQTASTGLPEEYATLDETLAPIALKRVAAFIKTQR